MAPTFGTDGVIPKPVVDCNIVAATFGLAADTPNPWVAVSTAIAASGISEGVIVLDAESIGASIVAATSGADDSAHDVPAEVEIEGSKISAPTSGTEGVSAEPIVGFSAPITMSWLTAAIANPIAAASVEVATSGTDGVILLELVSVGASIVAATSEGMPSVIVSEVAIVGAIVAMDMSGTTNRVISLEVASVGATVATATSEATVCVHSAPSTTTTDGNIMDAATSGTDGVSADASVGLTIAPDTLSGVGCVTPTSTGGDTIAMPTSGIVTSVIVLDVAIVGVAVVTATSWGVPSVIESDVAIVGAIVVAATSDGDGSVIPSAVTAATTAAATFGGVA